MKHIIFGILFSLPALANVPQIETKLYCEQASDPTKENSLFVVIMQYEGLISSHLGAFERMNGGRGPGDWIKCPMIRLSRGAKPLAGEMGYEQDDFRLDFDAPLSPEVFVNARLSNSDEYSAKNLPMRCQLTKDFPYVCDPHPYEGE